MSRKRPAIVVVEPVRARVVRGPRASDGAWYWRSEVYQGEQGGSRTIATFWAHRAEVSALLQAQISEHGLDKPPPGDETIETVRDLLETWIGVQAERPNRDEVKGGLSADGRRNQKQSGSRLCAVIGDVRLDRLNRATLERYRDVQLTAGFATETISGDFKRLATAWRWGRELGACPPIDLPKPAIKVEPVMDTRTPTIDEVARVLEQLSGSPRLFVLLLDATGCRPSEVERLTWGDVDLGGRVLRLRKTKTGNPRDVPIAAPVVAELRAVRPDPVDLTARLFCYGRRSYSKHLTTACVRAEVAHFTPYGLRRAAVDRMLRAGVDAAVAASITGHSVAVMLTKYRKPTDEDRRDAVARTGLGKVLRLPRKVRK